MKSKPVIISGLVVLVVLLVISIITVNRPQQAGIKAQTDAVLQCQSNGGFVTDQASCSGEGKQIVNVIGDSGVGGDGSTVQVCCKSTVINTPVPPRSCPNDTVEKPESECPTGNIVMPVDPVSPLANDGDNKYISPGIVCCRPDAPTPTTPTDPTPTSCPLPVEPVIKVTNVKVVCPGGCSSETQ